MKSTLYKSLTLLVVAGASLSASVSVFAAAEVVKGSFIPSIETPAVRGRFLHVIKDGPGEEMRIRVKIGLGDLITPENVDVAVVRAIFPDGGVCELDADDTPGVKAYEYALRLRVRSNGDLQEKDGFCDPHSIPTHNGAIAIEVDADGDVLTPNTTVATGVF